MDIRQESINQNGTSVKDAEQACNGSVQAKRRAQGIGKTIFCLIVGISRPILDKVESGAAEPDSTVAARIASALDTTPCEPMQ